MPDPEMQTYLVKVERNPNVEQMRGPRYLEAGDEFCDCHVVRIKRRPVRDSFVLLRPPPVAVDGEGSF